MKRDWLRLWLPVLMFLLSDSSYAQAQDIVYTDITNLIIHPGETFGSRDLVTPNSIDSETSYGLWFDQNENLRLETYEKKIVGSKVADNSFVLPLEEGAIIGPGSKWIETQGCDTATCKQPYVKFYDHYKDWLGETAFVGTQIFLYDRLHYAWLRISVADNGKSMTLLDYAFNAEPGAPIVAGDTGGSNVAHHETRTLCISITNRGNIGYLENDLLQFPHLGCDPPGRDSNGVGIRYNGENLLYDGGFLVGISSRQVSDCLRGQQLISRFKNREFIQKPATMMSVEERDGLFSQYGRVELADSEAPWPIGVSILQESFVSNTPEHEDFVILSYTITNDTPDLISGLHAGLFLDWDIGSEITNNVAAYYDDPGIGFVGTRHSNIYAGVRLLTDAVAPSYRAVDIHEDLRGGFTEENKWRYLSGGTQTQNLYLRDVAQMIGAGPYDIASGESVRVAFAIIVGNTLDKFLLNADNALALWETYMTTPLHLEDVATVPEVLTLGPIYPHPVVLPARFPFALSAPANVNLDIYDVLGKHMGTLLSGPQLSGFHAVTWDPPRRSVANGFYLLRWVVSGNRRSSTKFQQILLR